MDKIEKEPAKLRAGERRRVKEILKKLHRGTFTGLDIKKLKGARDVFRVRSGKIRVVFRIQKSSVFVLAIQRRTDTTYKRT